MRYAIAAFALLMIASTIEHWTQPDTEIVTACWTNKYDGQPICRGTFRRETR